MLINKVIQLSTIDRFTYWICEREDIRLRKEAGRLSQDQWTDDKILATYRFCNVIRMHDRVSKWLMNNWYSPNYGHSNMLKAVTLARFINKPESLERIGFPKKWIPERIKKVLREYRDAGNVVFNGAYMVRGNDGEDKISSVIDYYMKDVVTLKLNPLTMEGVHIQLMGCYGLGSFMAGQIVADLRWSMPGKWADKDTWAPIGPGSRRGMNRILDLDINSPMNQSKFNQHLTELIDKVSPELDSGLAKTMEAHDWQNCLCEFDKYERTLWDNRKPKQLYKPYQGGTK